MLPREHGAYSQMALPLVTALVIARAAPPSTFIALAVVCGFLAHEPLLVLLGGRGVRARQAMGSRAAIRFTLSTLAMLSAGAVAVRLSPTAIRWSLLFPVLPAAWFAANLLRGQEKRAPAEIAVALAFALTAVPICVAAGVPLAIALSVGAVFASVYVAGVLCVRVIVLGKRAGGNLHACRTTRLALIAIAVASIVGFAVATQRAQLPWTISVAVAPGLITALALATRRSPPPLKSVGWTLVLTSTAAALILIGAARHLS